MLSPDEAHDLLKHRCAVIQVWRPISIPIETDPLAICEAETLSPDDLIASERRYRIASVRPIKSRITQSIGGITFLG